jgi:hypothetical protein
MFRGRGGPITKNRAKLAAKVRDEPIKKRKANAKENAGNDRKIKSGVLAAMDDVAWETSEAERKFSAKVEEYADKNEKATEQDQRAAEFAKRIHRVHFSRNIWLRSFGRS